MTCQNITRHMIWDTLFLHSTAQAGNAFRTKVLHCSVINWYHSLSSLTVSLFPQWTGKLCHVCNVFQLVSLLLRKSKKNIINSHIHKCKVNMCLPYDTLQICVLQLCSEAGSWGVSRSSGRCQGSLSCMTVWDMRTSKGKTGLPWNVWATTYVQKTL